MDDKLDKNLGVPLNPLNSSNLGQMRKNATALIQPPQQVIDAPLGDAEAPYVYGERTSPTPEDKSSPGFFSTAAHTTWEMSLPRTVWNIGSNLYKDLTDHSPVPEGWDPTEQKHYFENVPEKYWGALADASSPKRQQEIFERIIEEIKDENFYAKGSTWAKLAGGIPGFYFSGASLIKVASYAKYSTTAESALMNMSAAAPGLTGQAIASVAVEKLGNAGVDAEEFALDTLQMMAFAGLLHTAGQSLKEINHNRKLYNAKDIMKAMSDGVEIIPELNPDGSIKKYVAQGINGKNLSAAEADRYAEFVNSKINESGLLQSKTMQKFLGNKLVGSALFRLRTGPFETGREFIATLTKNRFATVGEKIGVPTRITASEYQSEISNAALQLAVKIEGLRYKALGLSDKVNFINSKRAEGVVKNAESDSIYAQLDNGGWIQKIMNVVEQNTQSPISEVNQAAALFREFFNEVNKIYGKSLGLNDVAFVSTKDFLDYTPRVYDHEAIKLDVGMNKFIDNIVESLSEQDEKILRLMERKESFQRELRDKYTTILEDVKSRMRDDKYFKQLKKTGAKTEHLSKDPEREFLEETRAMSNEIAWLKKSLADVDKEAKAYWDSLLENDENRHLLVDGDMFSSEIRSLGEKWLGQLSELETLVDVLKSRSRTDIKKARKDFEKAASALYKTKTEAERIKAQADFKQKQYSSEFIEAAFDKELKDADKLFRQERSRLIDEARAGRMPRALYWLDADNNIHFINPRRAPELMKPFDSVEERYAYAEQFRDRILGLTDEQVNDSLFSGKQVGSAQPTAHAKARNRVIPNKAFNNGGFLTKNMTEMLLHYGNSMGKRIGINLAFRENPLLGSIDSVSKLLTEEYKSMKQAVLDSDIIKSDNPYEPIKRRTLSEKERQERDKKLKKIDKEFDATKKDINDMYRAYMGNGARDYSGFARSFKLYASSIYMGGLPISMTTEIAQQISRYGFPVFVAQGLKTAIRPVNALMSSKEAKIKDSIKDYASDAGVAMNVLRARLHMAQTTVGDPDIKVGGAFSRAAQFAGNAMGQISFANKITDVLHTMVVAMAQSRIMRNMHRYAKDGKLEAREMEFMANVGLDPKAWNKRFLDQFTKHGFKDKNEFYSEYTKWDDLEAYSAFKRAINRDVTKVHFEGTRFDNPSWANNPIASMMVQFMNWSFAALHNITVPILQGPDGRQAFALVLAIALGQLQEPLRAYINGREYEAPPLHKMAFVGVLNAGLLGQYGNLINMGNMAFGGDLLPGLLPQKYHDVGLLGAVAGIPGSIGDLVVGAAHDYYTGKITKGTIKKMSMLTPWVGAWQSRRIFKGLLDQLADNFNIPETARGVEGWPWWEGMKAKEE